MTEVAAPLEPPLFTRGSEWRRWDLQVHTPFSALNNGFGDDFDNYAKLVLERAAQLNIAVIGVTDYFLIDGYRLFRELIADRVRLEGLVGAEVAQTAAQMLLLPNVELRATVVVRAPDGGDSRVNFHVLFSNEADPDDIDEHFLRELRFTAQSGPAGGDERWSLTRTNLEALGRRLKAEHEGFRDQSDLLVGMKNAVISHEEVTEVLERQASRFQDRYLFIVPVDEDLSEISWDGQGHQVRKLMIQKAHMFFSSNEGTRQFGLGMRHRTKEEFLAEFKSLKPSVHGSDAHTFDGLFAPDGDRFTWIKADPTFRGLQQLLHEPESRVFVGLMPPALQRARGRATRLVDSITIRKTAAATLAEEWFDSTVPLNPELVVIIGNKGSGKSALTDVMGLVGNTQRSDAFSFLSPKRFRSLRDGKAQNFEAAISWADGSVDGPVSLAANVDPAAVERVRYIPQNYLEEICNEIGSGTRGRFYAELQQVIFSHVPPQERLGFTSLSDLLGHLGTEIDRTIELQVTDLQDINRQLSGLMERAQPARAESLKQALAEKQRELDALEHAKPSPILQPEEDEVAQALSKTAADELAARQADRLAIATALESLTNESGAVSRRRATAERLLAKLANLSRQVVTAVGDLEADLAELGLAAGALVTLTVREEPVRAILEAADKRRVEIGSQLDAAETGSLAQQRRALDEIIAGLEAQLSAPQLEYQTYLKELAEWEAARSAVIGSSETAGTIEGIRAALIELEALPNQIRDIERIRRRKMLEIFSEKQRLRRHFELYHRPVGEFLARHPLAGAGFELTFQTAVRQTDFRDRFFPLINRSRLGPFAGVDEGREALNSMLAGVDWNSALSVGRFTRELLRRMTYHDGRELRIEDQLVQGASVRGLFDLLFSLAYLEPVYELRWEGKGVDELSPGERGNLLLIFYLLVDREDIPLVIDQPEENLDNQTVVRTLVPCFKDAKTRRQIVIVTHNPNLAVVCDADQVIYAEMHKERGNAISYESGSIENPLTNQRIIDVLEGTRPAFDKRDARYRIAAH